MSDCFINKVLCTDNLRLLKRLQDNYIDLIYCDILYGTGKNFGDYKDLKADRNIINDFYISRFKQMYRVLKDTGSIYIHCDWRINHWIRLILDNIFGYYNFRNEIIWWYKRWSNASKNYQKMHDNIYFYSKTRKYIFNIQYQEYSKPEDIETTVRGIVNGKLQRLKDDKGDYIKRIKNNIGVPMHDIFELQHIQPTSKERTMVKYYSQKPKALLERIIKISSNKNDIVADFFCGSGTALVVAKELGRRYIGCDISKKAIEITNKRLKNSKINVRV